MVPPGRGGVARHADRFRSDPDILRSDLTAGSDLFDAGSSRGLTFRFGPTLEIRNGAATQLATGTGITISTLG